MIFLNVVKNFVRRYFWSFELKTLNPRVKFTQFTFSVLNLWSTIYASGLAVSFRLKPVTVSSTATIIKFFAVSFRGIVSVFYNVFITVSRIFWLVTNVSFLSWNILKCHEFKSCDSCKQCEKDLITILGLDVGM